ncbi:cell division protein ZapB [Zobellella endophytica]|uniref:Cell division protein ZapB n=1 Tax=Zobellella endophytica TaxID=2116700 RepID=A0A2P7R567_9GAMM|nr:cell division protein ZapB [Zobellella endophytica]PSJ45338.1 cell division protein ZapB [Zobellella endophytica]
MSFDVLEKLESKIQAAVDTISLLQMEVEELKEQNGKLGEENQQLKQQHDAWQERLRVLLGKIDQVEENA